MLHVWKLYDEHAQAFDRDRSRSGPEGKCLRAALARLPGETARILDLGCGAGDPIARFFIEAGHKVTGVDAASSMIEICRARFPGQEWVVGDMRGLALGRRFDAIVAWDSFFHLPQDDQRAMFPILRDHVAAAGRLIFTSGPAAGEAIGDLYGRLLYHASLDAQEYRRLLAEHSFRVLTHSVEDPDCGGHTVWLAEREQ